MTSEKTHERPHDPAEEIKVGAAIRGLRRPMSEEAKRDLRRVEKIRWWRPRTHPRRWE